MQGTQNCGSWRLLTIFDTGHPCVREAVGAAKKAKLLRSLQYTVTDKSEDVKAGLIFFPLRQHKPFIDENRAVLAELLERDDLQFVQDETQLRVYEDKIAQFELWDDWMPSTRVFRGPNEARQFLARNNRWPLVSKSRFGSASHAVRLLESKAEAAQEVEAVFGRGLDTGFGEQKGYVLWQRFVPHDVTWRVTIVGRQFSVYKRFNYSDDSKAAPASEVGFEPLRAVSDIPTSLLDFAFDFFEKAGTKYCAVDILQDGDKWRLLETAMSWARSYKPYLVPFIGTRYTFANQFDLLMEEIQAGVWNSQ